jgi:hypothetical protein
MIPIGRYNQKTQTRFELIKPGTLCKFHEELFIIFVNRKKASQEVFKRGTILMYIETIKHVQKYSLAENTIIYFDHKFLDLNGNIVMLAGRHSSSRALPSWEEVII